VKTPVSPGPVLRELQVVPHAGVVTSAFLVTVVVIAHGAALTKIMSKAGLQAINGPYAASAKVPE